MLATGHGCIASHRQRRISLNDAQPRGASNDEMRVIARCVGIDPRGMVGYYTANLLEKRDDGTRWLSPAGRERLKALSRVVLLNTPHE